MSAGRYGEKLVTYTWNSGLVSFARAALRLRGSSSPSSYSSSALFVTLRFWQQLNRSFTHGIVLGHGERKVPCDIQVLSLGVSPAENQRVVPKLQVVVYKVVNIPAAGCGCTSGRPGDSITLIAYINFRLNVGCGSHPPPPPPSTSSRIHVLKALPLQSKQQKTREVEALSGLWTFLRTRLLGIFA